MAYNLLLALMMAAAPVRIEAIAEARVLYPLHNQGCYWVTDRAECCRYMDGRNHSTAGHYHGQRCVPAAEGTQFTSGQICEPECWVNGLCGDGSPQGDRIGQCHASTTASLSTSEDPVTTVTATSVTTMTTTTVAPTVTTVTTTTTTVLVIPEPTAQEITPVPPSPTVWPNTQAVQPVVVTTVAPLPRLQVSNKEKVIAGAVAGSVGGAALLGGLLGGLLPGRTTAAPTTTITSTSATTTATTTHTGVRERFLASDRAQAGSIYEISANYLWLAMGVIALIAIAAFVVLFVASFVVSSGIKKKVQSRKRSIAKAMETAEGSDEEHIMAPLAPRSVPEAPGMPHMVTVATAPPVYVLPATASSAVASPLIDHSHFDDVSGIGMARSFRVSTVTPVYVLPASAQRVASWTHAAY